MTLVTILILIDGFLQYFDGEELEENKGFVTILILIDGFLQYKERLKWLKLYISHNPYFNRWFSAICLLAKKRKFIPRHNPYFNRWFSAILPKNIQEIW